MLTRCLSDVVLRCFDIYIPPCSPVTNPTISKISFNTILFAFDNSIIFIILYINIKLLDLTFYFNIDMKVQLAE